MSDRMDHLVTLAVRQGFQVWQTRRGVWFFRKGLLTVTARRTPESASDWLALVGALRAAGLTTR